MGRKGTGPDRAAVYMSVTYFFLLNCCRICYDNNSVFFPKNLNYSGAIPVLHILVAIFSRLQDKTAEVVLSDEAIKRSQYHNRS